MEGKLRFIITRLKKKGIKDTFVWVRWIDNEVDDYNAGSLGFVSAQARISLETALAGRQVGPTDVGKEVLVNIYHFQDGSLQEHSSLGHGIIGR